jgi:hypothetical protein
MHAQRATRIVVSVEYAVAHYDPYPAGLDDTLAVVQWLPDRAEKFNARHLICIGGESTGDAWPPQSRCAARTSPAWNAIECQTMWAHYLRS